GSVGGREVAQHRAVADLDGDRPAAGGLPGRARPRQLRGRHPEGHADPLGDRGGRADAHRQRDRRRELSLPRALHARGPDLPAALAAGRRGGALHRTSGSRPAGSDLLMDTDARPDMPMVRFDQVTKRYGDLVVLDRLDLEVATGETVTIIGPSGSGKTTVLRTLMTLEPVDGGVIHVDGEPLTHMERGGRLVPADRRHLRRMRGKIGMCFQQFNLFPHMTALENCMEGPVHVLGMSRAEARARAEELLEKVGMAD